VELNRQQGQFLQTMPRCHISLGGNSGPVAENFAAALDRLGRSAGTSVVAVSQSHETAPVGDEPDGPFLNAAAELETTLAPIGLLDLLHSIERDLGRNRTVHWGPRPIDLDLLYYESAVIDLPRLVVPHPAAWYRRFVLDPLVEIAPDLRHPVKQVTMRHLRDRLLARPLPVALASGTAALKAHLLAALSGKVVEVQFADWDARPTRFGEPVIIFWLGDSDGVRDPKNDSFERLPLLSRLDARTAAESAFDFVRHVLQSALGK
jgi:2-amino-4-hydroxy-6-hydroxymethyldihydropteridine diphosphokinase